MYATVSDICIALLQQHENNEKIAVITWVPEDVREVGTAFNPTVDDAERVLRAIGEADSDILYRYGIGLDFVEGELRQIAAERPPRQVAVPENELRALLPAICTGLDYIDDGNGAAQAALETLKRELSAPSA